MSTEQVVLQTQHYEVSVAIMTSIISTSNTLLVQPKLYMCVEVSIIVRKFCSKQSYETRMRACHCGWSLLGDAHLTSRRRRLVYYLGSSINPTRSILNHVIVLAVLP
jgi:hypothetical protein